MRRVAYLALLVAASLAACDSKSTSTPSVELQAVAGLGPSMRFLERMAEAPLKVAYSGKRRLVFDYAVDGQPEHMDYTEMVYSDGHGQFLITPGDVAAPPMTDAQRQVFMLLQSARDSFLYLHRDFRIREVALFEQNYSLDVLPDRTTVAGRSCVVMDVQSLAGGGSLYRVEVDPKTGLVMRCRETVNGAAVATVEFMTFTLNPDLTGVELHGARFDVEPIVEQTAQAQLGFPVQWPRLLPHGYQLVRAARIDAPGGPWVNATYGDGAEQVFYLFTDQPTAPMLHGSSPMQPAHTVRVYQIGPWTAAEGVFGNKRCAVVGKVGETALLDMIQSAME